ncbi:hypothetical protein GCM10009856_05790 [Mycolicibacterium llatzerense]
MPVDAVFSYMVDYRKMPEWVFGIKRITPVGDLEYGAGAVYEGALDLGPKTLSSTFEVTNWRTDDMIVLASIGGFDFTSTVRFTALGAAQTQIDIELSYKFGGGLAGKALARTLEPLILLVLQHSERSLQDACIRDSVAPDPASETGD